MCRKLTILILFSVNEEIEAIKVVQKKMAVLTANNIFIVNLQNLSVEHMVRDVYKNKSETFDLTEKFLAYQGEKGVVDIYDIVNMEHYDNIIAHKNSLSCLKLNKQSNAVATCSVVGTIVRIHKIVKKNESVLLLELRVTYTRYKRIKSVAFSPCVCFLAVVTCDEIKLFFIKEKFNNNFISETTTHLAYSLAGNILPSSINDLIRQKSSTNIIKFNLNNTYVKPIFKFHYGHLYLLVAFNTECLLKVYKLSSKNYSVLTYLVETISFDV